MPRTVRVFGLITVTVFDVWSAVYTRSALLMAGALGRGGACTMGCADARPAGAVETPGEGGPGEAPALLATAVPARPSALTVATTTTRRRVR